MGRQQLVASSIVEEKSPVFKRALGCPDFHNIQPFKLLFGPVMYGHHNMREILIFEGTIFSLWNHPFYCSFRLSVFKTVFVFMIGPILVVRVKI